MSTPGATVALCLDVNVWVSYYLEVAANRDRKGPVRLLVEAAFDGVCRLGAIRLVISHRMLDTLEASLSRKGIPVLVAARARSQVQGITGGGSRSDPPLLVLGGTAAIPLRDEEDAAVLGAAMAGRADLFVTGNMQDFVQGTRAHIETAILSRSAGRPDVAVISHAAMPGGLTIASPARAASWLVGGEPLPAGLPRALVTLWAPPR